MHRNGLIALAICFLTVPDLYSKDIQGKYLQNLKAGIALLDKGDHEGAYSRLRRANDKRFILEDYVHLFMAKVLRESQNAKKALSLIEKNKTLITPSPFLSELLGDIYSDLGRYDEACDSFSDYFKQSRDYRDIKTFSRFSVVFSKSSKPPEFFCPHIIEFLKSNPRSVRSGSPDYLEDMITAYSGKNDLASMYKALASPRNAMNIMRSDILWKGFGPTDLSSMSQIAQRLKDYRLKLKLLKELLALKRDRTARGKIEFQIALVYLNMDDEARSLTYFRRASRDAEGDFTQTQADYYCGRISEFLGDMTKAAFYYRKAKGKRYSDSEEKDFIIKSVSRAGWVNFKSQKYLSALKDYGYLVSRFSIKPSEDGYAYWYGMTLKNLGRLSEARTIFESLFTEYPLSYYAILGALKLKDIFGVDIITPHADPEYIGLMDKYKMRIFDRSLMLIELGMEKFAKGEISKLKIDYNNASEIVLASVIHNLLLDHRKSLALVDFLINQKKGMPSRDLLDLYYPVRYFNLISHLSGRNGVDPFMIFSLLRQESAFDPMAVSPSGAKGLMQVLPSLGLKTAKDLNLGDIEEEDLHFPQYNLKIGIAHFAELYSKFGKNIVLAASAYNSSESKVINWKKKYGFKNTEEFIEDIPYFETRNYAKMMVRNYANYLRIHGGDWREALKGGL